MWPWQRSYHFSLKYLSERVLKTIGLPTEVKVVVIGIRRPGYSNPNPICIEPEFQEWPLSMFDGIMERIEELYASHSLHLMVYTNDARAMDARPEAARRDAVTTAVKADFAKSDESKGVVSYVGSAHPLGDFHVVPVIQIPKEVVLTAPSVERRKYLEFHELGGSFLDACMRAILIEATLELDRPEPGVDHFRDRRSDREITERAAATFLQIVPYASARADEWTDAAHIEIFSAINELTTLKYERTEGTGLIVFEDPTKRELEYAIKLKRPVPFRDFRFARKLLQMSSADMPLIANGAGIHGLLRKYAASNLEPHFSVSVVGYQDWQVRYGSRPILKTIAGKPALPSEVVSRERFLENFRRVISGATQNDAERASEIMDSISKLDRGCMVIFAPDVDLEIQRLSGQGIVVSPEFLDQDLLESLSKIDGSILVDKSGCCHAVGVILDGLANPKCDPARGSRYNSAVRYVVAPRPSRLAIVRSDDGMIDVIPLLRPRIEHRLIEEALEKLQISTTKNYHAPRLFLDDHRFYLTAEECIRANLALDRLERLPLEAGTMMIKTARFSPDPDLNESYFM